MSADIDTLFDAQMLAIVDALRERARYRYVQPVVVRAARGWRVVSPCCSRNVDADGGVIDIAWFEPTGRGWRLHARDHARGGWVAHAEAPQLADLFDALCRDPARVFWP
jgi:hypothetical protein